MKLVDKLVNKKTGVFYYLEKGLGFKLPIPMNIYILYRRKLMNENEELLIENSGLSLGYDFFSDEKALTSALGEGVERYCSSSTIGHDLIYGSYNNLRTDFSLLNPLDITRVSDVQYKEIGIQKSIDLDTPFYWTECFDEIKKETKWVPANTVFMGSDSRLRENVIRDITSTGLAAGPTLQFAKERSLLECIERDAFTIMWLNQLELPVIDLDSIKCNRINKILTLCKEVDLKPYIIDISLDINVPVYFVLLENLRQKPPFIQVGAKAHFNPLEALEGALSEALSLFNLHGKYNTPEVKDITNHENLQSFADHIKYYAFGNGLNSLNFIKNGKVVDFSLSIKNKIDSFSSLVKNLNDKGITVLTKDLTTVDMESLSLKVVRTVVPEFSFLEVGIPMLECKRLKSVPETMGINVNNYFNKMPHPFP
ncbi:YcaO-like family protein [Pseudalkalibacillus hwajinpoensis]|uniref:Bacteriocin biosynthesis protein SagD n=1 Tax=Guptibacillus hwajinpoensis TaxID=208199 RepID=A0A4U1MH72_9BACL|nr:YcaO-like family protein [Pseudalkalibacillus hwajinpoensis]TKD69772.1 bacteriocin biosynthesis protein SagD [Pseudalkalibacillus hwajinpoensis]